MPSPHRSRALQPEAGVGLVEIVVVMVIVAILAGIAGWGIVSSRNTGADLSARTAARAYAAAIEEYARDHGGRYPSGPGTADWSSVPARGPVARELGGETLPYLREVPESVRDGAVAFGGTGGTARARLTYRQLAGGLGFEVRVDAGPRGTCVIVGGRATPPAGASGCDA